MGYQIGSITGGVINGISNTIAGSVRQENCFKTVTGTTYTEVWAKNWDFTDISYIDWFVNITNSNNNSQAKLYIDGVEVSDTGLMDGDNLETDIDVTAITGEKRINIKVNNDTAGQTSTLNKLEFNVRVT